MLALPEIKNLVEVSRQYLQDELTVHELNGWVQDCQAKSVALGLDEQIQLILLEYKQMLGRAWDEWSLQENPISEEEFKKWIRDEFLDDSDEVYQKFKKTT